MRSIATATLLVIAIAPSLAVQGTATLAHARQQIDARNWDAARQEYTALARATPTDVTPELYLSRIALALGETEEGIRHL